MEIQNIFDELDMVDSVTDYVSNFMDSYDNFFGFKSKYKDLKSQYKKKDGWEIPAGFIRSTIEDMGKYLQGFMVYQTCWYR